MPVEVQVRGLIADKVLIVLGVVPSVESEKAPSQWSVEVAYCVAAGGLRHRNHARFDEALAEARCLSHETANGGYVVLREHRWDGIPLGGEVEQREIINERIAELAGRADIDVGVLILHRVERRREILKG